MTKKEMEQYRHLGREIQLYQSQKKATRRNLAEYEQAASTVRGSMPQFPFTQHSIAVGNVPGYEDEQKAEIREYAVKIERLINQRQAVRDYIASIEDSELRQIFTLRYLVGNRKLEWGEVARKMGPGYSAESVRKRVKRFLQK